MIAVGDDNVPDMNASILQMFSFPCDGENNGAKVILSLKDSDSWELSIILALTF